MFDRLKDYADRINDRVGARIRRVEVRYAPDSGAKANIARVLRCAKGGRSFAGTCAMYENECRARRTQRGTNSL